MYKQKDIILIPFPYSDFSAMKQRPALIISNKKMDKTQDIICCLITRNPSKDCVLIVKDNFEGGKLPFKSWVKPYRIFTIHKGVIRKKLCTVKDSFFDEVLNNVVRYLERNSP